MSTETILELIPFSLFRFRVIVEQAGPIWTATCLETGNITTADDIDTVREMMRETLDDEWRHNVERCNIGNLLSTPAPISTWSRWLKSQPLPAQDEIEWRQAD